MRRLSKILVAALALCLLVGALALAISANSGIDGKFVVKGEGYETWEEALSAANNTHTIYLNEDWTLAKGINLSGATTNVKVNLNGKTVTVEDGSMLFNVYTNAKLTLEGEGTLVNNGAVLIGGSSYGEVTVNATGAGIVINNNATSGDVNTFRFQQYSTLNVSGKIVVNTNGVTSNRAIFNVSDSSKRTVNLNINDADILYATPSVTGAPMGKVIVSQFSNVNIESSRLEGVYSYVIYSSTTGSVSLAGYIIDKDATDAVSYGWDPAKIEEAKSSISIAIAENYTVKNSVIATTRATNYTGNSYTMYFAGATKADFTNCEIYGQYRAINGRQANNSWDAANIPNKSTDASQLTFVDCHVRACEGGSIAYLFCYGPNVRFLGGSISGVSTLANCQPHYIDLAGGQWLGVYVDNVLGVSGLKGDDMVVTTAWQNAATWNPASTITGTLPTSVTIVVGGVAKTFTTGYFSDMDKYNSYFPAKSVWEDYIVQKSDANVVGGSFIKEGSAAAVGTNPLGNAYTFGTDNGTSSYVYTNGNGYIKHFMSGGSGSQSGSGKYQQIVTTTASMATTDAFVWEWDVSTDDEQFLAVTFTAQAREYIPRFDANGNYIGRSALQYRNQPAVDITTANVFAFNGVTVPLSTAKGEWSRITVVIDIVRGELTSIDVPVYTDANTPAADGATVKKNAYKMTDSMAHVYVNGEYVSSKPFFSSAWGYDGYIVDGYAGNYYFDQIRIAPRAATVDGSYCVDNVRTSVYPISANVDLGLYNQDGSVKSNINGLEHFLIMPNNNAVEETYVASVDGVNYATESDAIAAIKEGSVVELLADLESCIPANVSFKLITNGYTVPGFISSTHKVLDYTALGFYKLVEADEGEIYTVNYEFNGALKTQTVALGTVIPEMTEKFPSKIEELTITYVTGWTLPVSVPNDYNLTGNEINATPITEIGELSILADGIGYETLAEAVVGAKGATITLFDDITVDAAVSVAGINATINLNGKSIIAGDAAERVFNVSAGGSLTITGAGAFENVLTVIGASGENTLVNFDADGATSGVVINHRTIEDGADTSTAISTFYITDKASLNVSGLVTVNAYNGQRIVFNVYNGAKALNVLRAKIVIPLLSRAATSTTPSGYSWVISAGNGIDINITESELYAIYGQLFHINGSKATLTVSSYKNADHSWKDTAAQGISIGEASMTLVAKNSRFFSEFGAYSQVMNASGWNPGASFMSLVGNLDAKFDQCTITTDWRGVTADAGITGSTIHKHQLLFTDCDFVSAPKTGATANAIPQFFMYGCNYRILGGTWARGQMSAGSNYYLPLKDASGALTGEWVGGYMDGVLVDSAKTHYYSGVTSGWSDSTYVERDAITCNAVRVTDGVARTFKAAYFGNLSEYINTLKAYEGFSAYYNTGDETTPFANVSFVAGNGTIDKTLGYVKHSYSGEGAISGYHNFDANNNANWHYGAVGAYVWEFDVSTDDGFFATSSFCIEGRYKAATFDAAGNYTGLGATGYEATYSVTIAGDTVKFNGNSVKISTEKGEWTKITVIFDVVLGEEKAVPVAEGSDVTVQAVDITGTTMSVYVDGVLLNSYNPITTGDYFGGCLAVDAMAGGYIDDLRIKNSATQASSICYDNIIFMPISHDFASADLGIVDGKGKPSGNITSSPIYSSLGGNSEAEEAPVIKVDGEGYTSVADANAAIKEGSLVELLADIDEAIEINYNNIKFKDNGNSFPGFVSTAYKFIDYTAARGAKYSTPAAADEIFVIEYPEYNGVSGTQIAVLGTLMKVPAEFDAVSEVLNKEAKEYQTLLGWSLSETEDVFVVTASGVAYPKVESVKAVVVYWTNADGSEILDTDFYFPGATTVLDEFDGTEITTDYSQNAYYGIARTAWAGVEEATAGLATSGEYTIKAVMGKVAPKTFPGLKYGLSLYSNYVMNFYVPSEIEGVSDVVVSTISDGTASITKLAPEALDGVAYNKFGYILGIADTEIKTFYLVYNVGEDRIAFPVYVGVPTYADYVMEEYANDTSAKGEAIKALVVNMANYATKVLALNGNDMTSEGAEIYAGIVDKYEAYLSYFNGLTNDKFALGGELYNKHRVDSLNFVTKSDENLGNIEALTYIKSIGFNFNTFEPSFIIKFSDAAIAKGLQAPDASGATEYNKAGLHLYSGTFGQSASKTWAEKDGNKYYGDADIWATYNNGSASIDNNCNAGYEYYAMANSGWDDITESNIASNEWYKDNNIRANLTIKVYWSASDSATQTVGEVNYNLAAYINAMLRNEAANEAYIEAAKAIYAYSYVAEVYGATN